MDSGFEMKVVDELGGHQRHDPVWPGLDLYLGHDVVSDDAGDQAGELIASRDLPAYEGVAWCGVEGVGEAGQFRAVHGALPGWCCGGGKVACLGAVTQGLSADSEQLSGLMDRKNRHAGQSLINSPPLQAAGRPGLGT